MNIESDWTVWRGGVCPINGESTLEVQTRYAGLRKGRAVDFRWSHDLYYAYGAEDIIRYRLISEGPQTA